MLDKDFRVLRLRSVAGIRIHHELDIGQVLGQQEGGELVEKQQGNASRATEAPVRKPYISDLDGLCASGFVRNIGHPLLLEQFQLPTRLMR